MITPIDRYRECARICKQTDYGSKKSVRQHNAAADEMRAIVEKAHREEIGTLTDLLPLLEEPPADTWLAYQLLKLRGPHSNYANRCLNIIERVANSTDITAFGAQMWLKKWRAEQKAEPAA